MPESETVPALAAVSVDVVPDSAPGLAAEASAAVVPSPPPADDAAPAAWPDESAESAFLSEARERGESVPARPPANAETTEDVDPKSLPALDDLVNRIPEEVRETLEDLFRARFVSVKRVPKQALKAAGKGEIA